MGENSKISWTHHTFNPWWGCTKVSPGCTNCYADALDARIEQGRHWGPKAPRRFFGEKHWNKPLKWNEQAKKAGERHRVFCASVADWAETHMTRKWNNLIQQARFRLFGLIQATPHLDWLLLTKRIENAARLLPWTNPENTGFARTPWPNVWVGCTAENQEQVDTRVPVLCSIPAVVRFVSYEPALEPVTFGDYIEDLDWVIAGAESGRGRRPMDEDWVRSVRDECGKSGTAFFYKQKIVGGGVKVELPKLDGTVWAEFPDQQEGLWL